LLEFWLLIIYRIKEKLRSGEMAIPGDQWPVFLYRDYRYDAEDPWAGLLRSSLLIMVRILSSSCRFLADLSSRRSNMYSLLPAQ
jgi:hypothetical protein